jgi:hypothetical protein
MAGHLGPRVRAARREGVVNAATREYLTLDELVRAMALLSSRNVSTVVTIHSYRTHTGDPFVLGGKAAWDGPLAHEVRVKLAMGESYMASAEIERLIQEVRDLGFEVYFTDGGYEEGYFHVAIGRQGKSRVLTEEKS